MAGGRVTDSVGRKFLPATLSHAHRVIRELEQALKESQAATKQEATRLRILAVGLGLALPNIEHYGAVKYKRGPNKGKIAGPRPQEVAQNLRRLLERVYDDKLCNDDSKWIYFCERKRGHKGRHREYSLTW